MLLFSLLQVIRAIANLMETVSLSLSAARLPQNIPQGLNNNNNRCVSKVIKYQIWHSRRPPSFSSHDRVPSFRLLVTSLSKKVDCLLRVAACLSCERAMAEERGNSQSTAAIPNSVPVRVAHELMQAGHHYLDVRTTDEYSASHVVGALNAPFMLKTGSGMTRNPKFLEEVLNHFGKDDEIIVGCQIGKRSFMAASELISAGFTGITDMAGGYAAWVQNGLPTTAD